MTGDESMKLAISPLSGFQQLLPSEQLVFDAMTKTIRDVYRRYGFVPLETPAVERKETLLAAKGGIANQVYTLARMQGEAEFESAVASGASREVLADTFRAAQTEMALRFDLTVPLARFVSATHGALTFPFRRFQIQPVWRGERAQAGRYRQFLQCDVDIIGDQTLPLAYDAEIPAVVAAALDALGVGEFEIHVNNMQILHAMLTSLGVVDAEKVTEALRCIDAMDKESVEVTRAGLRTAGITDEGASRLLSVFSVQGDMVAVASQVFADSEEVGQGLRDLAEVYDSMCAFGVAPERIVVNLSIARGLNYYTGTVYETFLKGNRQLGSVSSGGRYENLTENLGGRKFPGVGMTLGLSRLFTVLRDRGEGIPEGSADVCVTSQDASRMREYMHLTTLLRRAGIRAVCVVEAKKLVAQLKYADKIGARFAVVANATELDEQVVLVKDLRSREQKTVSIDDLVAHLVKVCA